MDKDRCLHLCDELEKRQFVTWIDLRHQGDFLYEKLALAVENAYLLLICYRQEYQDSELCRHEALYAKSLGKPLIFVRMDKDYKPNNWLGFMLTDAVRIDFSHNKQIDDFMIDLLPRIKDIQRRNSVPLSNNQTTVNKLL